MTDLQKAFEKEPKTKRMILGAAGVAFVSTFFPWASFSLGSFGGVSVNGWHSYGLLTALGSLAMILLWLLPKVGVKFKLPVKEDALNKALPLVILAGSVLWLIDTNFEFGFAGIGLYVALAAGAVATLFTFKK